MILVVFVVAALLVGILLGLALADVRSIRLRQDVGWQVRHVGADDEWGLFLWQINHEAHEPRHAIEAGVS